jgi:hypothetical protein
VALSRFQRWWRVNAWRTLCWVAVGINAVWVINLYRVGVSYLLPGKFSVSICCGMVLIDEDPPAPSGKPVSIECQESRGLRMVWYEPMDLQGLSRRAPFLPFSERTTSGRGVMTAQGWSLGIPFWPAIVLCYGGAILIWWRKRERLRLGLCTYCGYCLAGQKSSRCPECGYMPGLD